MTHTLEKPSATSAGLMNASMLLYLVWLLLPAVQTTGRAVTGVAAVALFGVGVLLASSLLAGGGFGALLYAPRKAIIWGGLLGSAGYLCYWAAMECGAAETAAMFIGALVAALGAQIAARRLKMIATVFVTIAILPLVPGVGLYRAMSALATGDMMAGASIAAHTMALILMIALGIGLGTALVGADRGAKH